MSSEDFVEKAFEGITRGAIREGKETVKESIRIFVKKFNQKKLAFVQDEETIKLVKDQKRSGEVKYYKDFVPDKSMLNIISLGLTLRKLEVKEDMQRINNLRNKIFKKYGIEGLHIAQVVQNGILSRYMINLVEQGFPIKGIKQEINNLLNNVEKYVCFVTSDHVVEQVIDELKAKVNSHSPSVFILSGTGSAKEIVLESFETILELNLPYVVEKYSGPRRELFFFNRII